MISIKTKEEIAYMREGGRRLAAVLRALKEAAVPGASTVALDQLAQEMVCAGGDHPAFLNYQPDGASRPFPAALCLSINDEVVHGIPNETDRALKEGDVVSLDMGLVHEGFVTDSAITVVVGEGNQEAQRLLDATKGALMAGIAAVKDGNTVGDIGAAIQEYVKPYGYAIFEELGGHGVGRRVHEDPHIPNFGRKGQGTRLRAGMTIAIEPMLGEGGKRLFVAQDGYTYKTKDGSRAAHFEHTIAITEGGSEILTM